MVLPGSCCPLQGLVPLPQAAATSLSAPAAGLSPPPLRPGAPPRRRPCPPCRPGAPLPLCSLLGLGLLQTGLGCALVALGFGALWLSSAPQVKNACPLWAGSSAIFCGILGLTTWKKPMLLLGFSFVGRCVVGLHKVNLFVLLSMISVMLNVTGLILGCQGILFVSSVPRCDLMDMDGNKTCLCCEELHPTTCTEAEAVLKLYHVKSCGAAHLLLKKVLLALSALNALTATVCFVAAALHYLQILASRRSCTGECEVEDGDHNLDPDGFVPPVPPPPYFAVLSSCTPQTSHRLYPELHVAPVPWLSVLSSLVPASQTFVYKESGTGTTSRGVNPICELQVSTPVSDVISLPYIYVRRIKEVEVFCPLDPPPPYETVCSLNSFEQGDALQINGMEDVDSGEVSDSHSSQGFGGDREAAGRFEASSMPGRAPKMDLLLEKTGRVRNDAEEIQEPSSRVSLSPSNASCVPAGVNRRAFDPLQKRSKSDPVLLHCQLPQGTVLSYETATLSDINPLSAVTLRKSSRARAVRGRPRSLIDYKSYMDTKRRVAWILEQSSCSMSPEIHDLVENIKSVLKSDEEHMAEAVTSATVLEQMMTPAQKATSLRVRVSPFRLHPGLMYLESCGDLSTFTTEGEHLAERRNQRAERERPHSVIGVVRETVL